MHLRTALAAVMLIAATSASVAAAGDTTRLTVYQDWSLYTGTDNGGNKVCYIASTPSQSLPTGVNRDPVIFNIYTSPTDNEREYVSVAMGYPLNADVPVTATIDNNPAVQLYTRLDTAADGVWVENPAVQAALVVAMKAGTQMVVRGRSQRGTDTTDTYSLRGVTAALDAMGRECPMPAQ